MILAFVPVALEEEPFEFQLKVSLAYDDFHLNMYMIMEEESLMNKAPPPTAALHKLWIAKRGTCLALTLATVQPESSPSTFSKSHAGVEREGRRQRT